MLLLDRPAKALGLLSGFSVGDTITLANTTETSFAYANGRLSIFDGKTSVAKLDFTGAYSQQSFNIGETARDVVITYC
jgi:hypothetical protein